MSTEDTTVVISRVRCVCGKVQPPGVLCVRCERPLPVLLRVVHKTKFVQVPMLVQGCAHCGLTEEISEFNLEAIEARTIKAALDKAGGSVMVAAKWLGIGKTTIYRKMIEMGLVEKS